MEYLQTVHKVVRLHLDDEFKRDSFSTLSNRIIQIELFLVHIEISKSTNGKMCQK